MGICKYKGKKIKNSITITMPASVETLQGHLVILYQTKEMNKRDIYTSVTETTRRRMTSLRIAAGRIPLGEVSMQGRCCIVGANSNKSASCPSYYNYWNVAYLRRKIPIKRKRLNIRPRNIDTGEIQWRQVRLQRQW